MKKHNVVFILYALFSILTLPLHAGGSKEDVKPMRIRIPEIRHQEMLTYRYYLNEEIIQEVYFVSEQDADGKFLRTYVAGYNLTDEDPWELPRDYHDYWEKSVFSLETGRIVSFVHDTGTEQIGRGLAGTYMYDLNLDQRSGDIRFVMGTWDGYEKQETVSRMKVKPGYMVTSGFTAMMDFRFGDIEGGGLAAMIQPFTLADPIYGTVTIKGREKLKTPAGTFDTIRIGVAPADPMVRKLLGPLADGITMWIDTSPSRYVVKRTEKSGTGDMMTVLTGIGTWTGETPPLPEAETLLETSGF